MNTFKIKFRDKEYDAAEITIFADTPEEMTVMIATTELDEVITLGYEKDEQDAIALDEKICYYVEPFEMNLPYADVVAIVEASYD